MLKYLFIAEKPSLMREVKKTYDKHKKDINAKVGEIDFTALSGHVCRYILPNEYEQWNKKWNELELPMIPKVFKIDAISDKKKMINDLKKKIKDGKYDGIIVGTDSDVEGNGIYYLLENYLSLEKMKALRFFENDLTDKALYDSLMTLTDFHKFGRDVHMTEAFKIRSMLDWLIGMNFSVGFSVKSGFTMKVGSVKAPTLKLVYDNSMEIENFKSFTDYGIKANYKEKFSGILFKENKEIKESDKENNDKEEKLEIRFKTKKEGEDFLSNFENRAKIKKIEKKTSITKAPQLYKLSDLQVEAGKEFGYSPAKTLELLQSLYENHKLVSYPRTDGRYISSEKAKDLKILLDVIQSVSDFSEYVKKITISEIEKVKKDKRIVNDEGVKEASHDALLPTTIKPNLTKLSNDEKNILFMIYKRLLALFMPELKEEKTSIITEVLNKKDKKLYTFKTTGKVVLEKGFTVLYNKKLLDEELPKLKEGDILTVANFATTEKTTTPPKRLTTATLIAAMENIDKYIEDKKLKTMMKSVKGIGMPSSRAKIIDDLIKAKYILDKKKSGLFITEEGKEYIKNIEDFSIVKPEQKAIWETKMFEIKQGTRSYKDTEKEMYDYIKSMIKEIESKKIEKKAFNFSKSKLGTINYSCPLCFGKIISGKFGWFCSNNKEKGCKFSIPEEVASKKISDTIKKELLENKTTKIIKGFKKKDGTTFDSKLTLKDGKVSFTK